jgi:hypothetical protein
MAILSLTVIYRGESGMPAPDYVKCKESLVTQIVTGKCTERSSVAGNAAEMNGNAR